MNDFKNLLFLSCGQNSNWSFSKTIDFVLGNIGNFMNCNVEKLVGNSVVNK